MTPRPWIQWGQSHQGKTSPTEWNSWTVKHLQTSMRSLWPSLPTVFWNKIFYISDIFDELHVRQQKVHPSVSTAGSKCTEVASPEREFFHRWFEEEIQVSKLSCWRTVTQPTARSCRAMHRILAKTCGFHEVHPTFFPSLLVLRGSSARIKIKICETTTVPNLGSQ